MSQKRLPSYEDACSLVCLIHGVGTHEFCACSGEDEVIG